MKHKIVLALAAIVSSFAAFAAKEVVDGVEWTYTVNNGEARIYGEDWQPAIPSSTTGDLTIPSQLGGYPVTRIGYNAFLNCTGLTSVVIPEGVTSIDEYYDYGYGAFSCCTGLKSVTLPSSITNIGDSAFYNCYGLKSVTIPENVMSIGEYAFYCCSGLTSVTISSSVTSIGCDAFYDCYGLKSVTIPSSVTSLGGNCFKWCTSLETVYVDDIDGEEERIKNCLAKSGIDVWFVDFVKLSNKEKYNVVFKVGVGGTAASGVELSQTIEKGKAAFAPAIIPNAGYAFIGWNADFSRVTSNMTVTAQYIDARQGGACTVTNYVAETITTTNVVTETKYETKTETIVVTNFVDVATGDSGVVSGEIQNFVPQGGLDGTEKLTMNGIAFDKDGKLCGLAQIATAKATKKGVKVSGFVMAADGKKYTLKAATSPIVDGFVTVSTTAGKLGAIEVVVGADGFRGMIANGMTIVSAETDDTTGILSGTLKLSYFNDKSKLATKNLTVGGTAAEGVASGTVGAKNQSAKKFVTTIE